MNDFKRLKFLRITICLAFLVGIIFSHELWFPVFRTFPRAPVFFEFPENIVVFAERCLSALLVLSLVFIALSFRSKVSAVIAFASLLILISLDQTRLQPWVYQYFLLLAVLALSDTEANDETASRRTLGLLQIAVAGLYVWSGAQKLNFTFAHETLPMLLAPAQNFFPAFQTPPVWMGIAIAITEALIGAGLLFRHARNVFVWLTVAMHAVILTLLIAKSFNSIVWVWNAALIVMIFVLFWRSDVSVKQSVFQHGKANDWKINTAKLLVAASVILPVLSFCGWWDLYISGALYSGNTPVAVVRIDEAAFEKLPAAARQTVFQTKTGGERMLPLFEWAIAELNVPVYPENRVFKQVARQVCELTNQSNEVELIVKERPATLDGSYRVARAKCPQIRQ